MERAFKGTPEYIDFLANKSTIQRILKLREEKNVLILGHNYMTPLVFQVSGEGERGDSLQLAQYAARSSNPIILFDGVRFMAETAKILNPGKKVLIADDHAGCSLADPFRGEDVRRYKEEYPGRPVVLYINSYTDAKAEADYCCTSSNGLRVVKHAAQEFKTDEVIFLPDSLMGQNLQDELEKERSPICLIYPGKRDDRHGSCEVHEQITPEMVRAIREQYNLKKEDSKTAVLVHWECKPEVLKEADFYGSTSGMRKYVIGHPELERVYLGTECEMTANLQNEFPGIEFVRSCTVFCRHMRKITLDKMLDTLELESPEVTVPEHTRRRALRAIERMLAII
ncbi:MAG: quinolinate synthase [Alphaproteobacteria bacterium]